MSENPPQEKKASEQILEKIDQASRTLTEEIQALGKRPEIITLEDAKVLRDHIETCTEPGCPYKPIFPELAPEHTEAPEEQATPEATETSGTEHKPPRRWSVSEVGRGGKEGEG